MGIRESVLHFFAAHSLLLTCFSFLLGADLPARRLAPLWFFGCYPVIALDRD